MPQAQKSMQGYKNVEFSYGKYITIPEEWEVVRIGDISKVKRGASPRPIANRSYFGTGRGWVRIADVTKSFKYLEKTEDYLSSLGESKSVPVNEGDLIMSIAATVGKPIIVKMKACIHDGFILFSNLSKSVDVEFLYYLVSYMEGTFSNLGQHGTQSNINTELVSLAQFPRPTLLEQQKIAAIISKADELIQKTAQIIERTQRLRNGLMHKLLTKGIGHSHFKKVRMGFRYMLEEYPEEWEIAPLVELCKIERGKFAHRPRDDPDYYGGKYPFIQTGDIESSNGYITYFSQTLNEKGLSVSKMFPSGVIAITIAATIGSVGITTFPVCFPDSVVSILPSKIDLKFLYYFLKTRKRFLRISATVSAQPNINLETLRPLLTPVPSIAEQRKIASILSDIDSIIQIQIDHKSKLYLLKTGLMQKLLTGKIRIKV